MRVRDLAPARSGSIIGRMWTPRKASVLPLLACPPFCWPAAYPVPSNILRRVTQEGRIGRAKRPLQHSVGEEDTALQRRIEWQKIKIDSEAFESACVFDVDGDGIPDIVCGGYWYRGPDWTKHKLCDVRAEGEYYDDFSTIPMDVNGDGYTDFVTGGWWGQTLVWRENPGPAGGEWRTHKIAVVGSIETTRAWDVDGDGELEIVPNTPGNPLRVFKLERDASGRPAGRFREFVISPEPQGHGLGFGDISGDGTMALVTPGGWWEAPKGDPLKGEWKFHPEFDLGTVSVPILVEDVNGDGVPEIVAGQAHGYGLDYWTQQPGPDGCRIWTRHPVDPWFSQYHEMLWVDVDGDGCCELLTGNRYRAHCGNEPGETDIVGLFYFKWNGESFTKCVIDYGKVGEHSGTGIFMWAGDIDGDGRLDIVAPGKEGLFLFRNLGPERAGE